MVALYQQYINFQGSLQIWLFHVTLWRYMQFQTMLFYEDYTDGYIVLYSRKIICNIELSVADSRPITSIQRGAICNLILIAGQENVNAFILIGFETDYSSRYITINSIRQCIPY